MHQIIIQPSLEQKKIEIKLFCYNIIQAQYNAPQQIGTIIYDLENMQVDLHTYDDKNKEVIAKHKDLQKVI